MSDASTKAEIAAQLAKQQHPEVFIERIIRPTYMEKERWMKVKLGTSSVLFCFSGMAYFGYAQQITFPDELDKCLIGAGKENTKAQLADVRYSITDMYVGPHWLRLEQVCPLITVGGHLQDSPDDADYMGWRISPVTKINLVDLGGFQRIELQFEVIVRGGVQGRVLRLAYQVQAAGMLANDEGDEGKYYKDKPDLPPI